MTFEEFFLKCKIHKKNDMWETPEYYDFQKKIINDISENRFIVVKKSRQMYVTTTMAIHTAWMLVHGDKGKTIGYVAPKSNASKYFITLVKTILFENFGLYMKHSQDMILLPNGNKLIRFAPISDALCGYSLDMLIIDDAAFVKNLDQLISSFNQALSEDGKFIIISTPNGYNYFYKIYHEATIGQNEFKTITIDWGDNPKYDKKWFDAICKAFGYDKFKIDSELWGLFVDHKLIKTQKAKTNIIQFRLDDIILSKIGLKLIEKDMNMSDYLRYLIEKDL